MNKRYLQFLSLLVLPLLLATGCSKQINLESSAMLAVDYPKENNGGAKSALAEDVPIIKGQKTNLLMEPHETVGLKVTPSIKKGEVSVYHGIFPNVLFGEYYPGRIRWNAVVRQKDGKEFFAQHLFSPLDNFGNFTWIIVVDGYPDKTARIVQLSTAVNFGYSPLGDEFPIKNRADFLEDKNGSRAEILEKGTLLSELKKMNTGEFYREYIGNWNVWKYEDQEILSPLGIKEVQEIAAINPQYGFMQKLIATGNFMLCADPIATTASAGIDFFRANGAPSAGWDFNSELPTRRNMGLIIGWVGEMQRKRIVEINRHIAQKY